jgi:hypothetical protein
MSLNRQSISENKSWNTPPKYIDVLNKFFKIIDLDPCSNDYSLVNAKNNIKLPQDGLKIEWNYNTIFVNPPYGRDKQSKTSIYDWVLKGYESNKNHKSEIIFLIPVATNTKHFKNIIFKHAKAICFLEDTRLKFWQNGQEDKKGAPMACCFVYFGIDFKRFCDIFSPYGKVFEI